MHTVNERNNYAVWERWTVSLERNERRFESLEAKRTDEPGRFWVWAWVRVSLAGCLVSVALVALVAISASRSSPTPVTLTGFDVSAACSIIIDPSVHHHSALPIRRHLSIRQRHPAQLLLIDRRCCALSFCATQQFTSIESSIEPWQPRKSRLRRSSSNLALWAA